MAQITIASGETETVASGETLEGGPILLDGTLALDGTLEAGETTMAGAAGLGVDAVDPILPGAKNIVVDAAGGVTAVGVGSKSKDVVVAAGLGVDAGPVVESLVPLRRTTTRAIDESRRSAFDSQGSGETTD